MDRLGFRTKGHFTGHFPGFFSLGSLGSFGLCDFIFPSTYGAHVFTQTQLFFSVVMEEEVVDGSGGCADGL